ncbi:MAG: NUDIX domain-containing protein [Bdellovibrionota bacterium]
MFGAKNLLKSKWALQGGFVEADENLNGLCQRELCEETGYE